MSLAISCTLCSTEFNDHFLYQVHIHLHLDGSIKEARMQKKVTDYLMITVNHAEDEYTRLIADDIWDRPQDSEIQRT
jgi:hypothetical protein